jgi:heme ABC exporter ATP-binding subunit CcmA
MPDPVITCTDITYRYGQDPALKNISLTFSAGETALVLGRNGSGKSTLLKVLAGLLQLQSGAVHWQVTTRPPPLGYLGHLPLLYPHLTVAENLELFTNLATNGKAATARELAAWGLTQYHTAPVATLSKGLIARVGLARAFALESNLLILDEPSAALDQESIRELVTRIRAIRAHEHSTRKTIIIATHDFEALHAIADRFLILKEGTLAFDSMSHPETPLTLSELSQRYFHSYPEAARSQ